MVFRAIAGASGNIRSRASSRGATWPAAAGSWRDVPSLVGDNVIDAAYSRMVQSVGARNGRQTDCVDIFALLDHSRYDRTSPLSYR
jgi:hypothetical protein